MHPPVWAGLALILLLSQSACVPGEHSHDGDASHAHEEETERSTVAVTNWTARSELFMEYPVLVAGEAGRFAIHVTDLADFAPLTTGDAVVVLRGRNGEESRFRGGISRPGIFGADVTPVTPGEFDFEVRVETDDLQDVHELGQVTVHDPSSAVPVEAEDEGESISFLKEQQWILEFGTEEVASRGLQQSFVVPAMLKPRAGGEALLAAPVPGRVDSSLEIPVPGTRVRAGKILVRIEPRSEEFQDPAGLRSDLVDAEQEYEVARLERDRIARLVAAGVVPDKMLIESEAAVTARQARLEAARQRIERLDGLSREGASSPGGDSYAIRAPFDGVVAEVRIASGASVDEGDMLLRLVDTDSIHVVGAVPESNSSALKRLAGAELLRDEDPPLALETAALIGAMVDPMTRTVEVRYALDNRDLRFTVGRGVHVRLFVGDAEDHPAVPESAIVDDGGRPVVFVQTGGESFERRSVHLGNREGGYVHLLDGVEPGERVVSRGAYLIRLAVMSTQIPAHGHVH